MRQLRAPADPLLVHRLADQPLGQLSAFAAGQHPADHVAAEDVEDHVEVEVGPLRRPLQLGDVPRPDLIRRGGQQLRLGAGRVAQLVASLADLAVTFEDAVHRARRAEVGPLPEKLRRRPRPGRRRRSARCGAPRAPPAPHPRTASAAARARPFERTRGGRRQR